MGGGGIKVKDVGGVEMERRGWVECSTGSHDMSGWNPCQTQWIVEGDRELRHGTDARPGQEVEMMEGLWIASSCIVGRHGSRFEAMLQKEEPECELVGIALDRPSTKEATTVHFLLDRNLPHDTARTLSSPHGDDVGDALTIVVLPPSTVNKSRQPSS
ncbi:hypothetical protein LTR17_014406 [Elasticomyces elasticus]|nr:hypothetical protein LTR17_014406 [Elasticomyces elasticus]